MVLVRSQIEGQDLADILSMNMEHSINDVFLHKSKLNTLSGEATQK